jgi:hypothetical protein
LSRERSGQIFACLLASKSEFCNYLGYWLLGGRCSRRVIDPASGTEQR